MTSGSACTVTKRVIAGLRIQPVQPECVSECYLVCSFYGEELMLPFCSAHIPKRPIICHISGDEGDLIHHMLMFNHLSCTDIMFC